MRKGIGRLWRLADGGARLLGWAVAAGGLAGYATGFLGGEVRVDGPTLRAIVTGSNWWATGYVATAWEWRDLWYLTAGLAAAVLAGLVTTNWWAVGYLFASRHWMRGPGGGKGDR
jgi:hypothetical protein